MPGSLMPAPVFTGWDGDGDPLVGGKLYLYLAGTSTPSPGYADAALAVPLTNPVVLDAAGRAIVFLDALAYKFVLKTSADILVWEVDGVQATHVAADSGGIGDIFYFGGNDASPVVLTAYPAGAGFDKLHAGTSVFSLDSGNLHAGVYVLRGMLVAGGGGTVTAAIVNLSDGTPDTAMEEIASANATGALVDSDAITFPAAGATKQYGIKVKVTGAGAFGFAYGLRLVLTALS